MAFPMLTQIRQWLSRLTLAPKPVVASLVLTSLTLTGLILLTRQWGWLQTAELALYDQFIQLQPDEGPDNRFLVVGVTELDLQQLQEWPLSDRTMTRALEILEAADPRVIAIDIFRDIPAGNGRQELLQQINKSARTLVVCKVSSADNPGTPPLPGVKPVKINAADLVIDPGGILRRGFLWLTPPDQPTPQPHYCNTRSDKSVKALGFSVALNYLVQRGIKYNLTPDKQIVLGGQIIPKFRPNTGGYRQVDGLGYQVLLRYRSEQRAVPQVSLQDLLNQRVSREQIRDRMVLIGYTSSQVKDDFYTPYSSRRDDRQKMPGVIVHAQIASQLVSAVLNQRALIWVWDWPAEVAWIWVWALVGGGLAWYLRHPLKCSLGIAAASGGIYGVSLLIFFQGGWIPLVPAIVGCVGTAMVMILFDRFNQSAYGQTVYRKVKTLLHLDVELDQEKVEKQVTEITETDYFRDLQNTVKNLRSQATEPDPSHNQADATPPAATPEPTDDGLDYFDLLKQESQSLKEKNGEGETKN